MGDEIFTEIKKDIDRIKYLVMEDEESCTREMDDLVIDLVEGMDEQF